MRIFIASLLVILIASSPRLFCADHPRLFFGKDDIPLIKSRAAHPQLKPVADKLMQRAQYLLSAPPIIVSTTKRGEPDPPGESKGIACARALQGRVLTFCMAFTLSGDTKFRDAALRELEHAATEWKIWVDTAHAPPFDLMTGETCFTFGAAYDWLYNDLTKDERKRIRESVEKRGLQPYLDGIAKKMFWSVGHNNWVCVCNGGATVCALALDGESKLSSKIIESAVPSMKRYWDHLHDDGGWDEGTGYWTYGNRYGIMAAEALRRCGKNGGEEVFAREGVKNTCYFPIMFNPGAKLTASFGDSNGRASDPIFYLLGREYKNADFIYFQDRAAVRDVKKDGWPSEAFSLIWRPVDEDWLPEKKKNSAASADTVRTFPSIGWGMMAPRITDPPYFLAFKNGSLAASHTHLDLNHISVAYGDTFLLEELGSRPYPADYFSSKRNRYYEISTAGHNTVLVSGKGQLPGKQGKLISSKGDNWEMLTGIADGAYECPTTRVRRNVLFVAKKYWVILDDIVTPDPQIVELRFHTYGMISSENGRHCFEFDDAALDLVQPAKLAAEVQRPEGWIKAVNVLSLSESAAREHAIVTVLAPRSRKDAPVGSVSAERNGETLSVKVGDDEIVFTLGNDGWAVKTVKAK